MDDCKTLDDIDVKGKRVLVRADLNVPMKDGHVTDALRIERQAPTIRELAEKGARVIVLSHFDRPKGKIVPSMSLKPIAPELAKAIGRPVAFADDCVGPAAESAVAKLKDGDVVLLENTRFHPGEEKNDPELAKQVAKLGDIFVNDAFSAAHRAHATTEGIAHLLPSAAGRSMEAELAHLHQALDKPKRPLMAVIGGAKISTKIELLGNLVKKVDTLVIGGAMANTFLAARGVAVGKSLSESDQFDTAREIMNKAQDASTTILLPVDAVVAKEFKANAEHRTVWARRPLRPSARGCKIRRLWYGTGRSARSRRRLSTAGRWKPQSSWPGARARAGFFRSPAAEIRSPLSIMRVWRTRSPMSRPRAARSWNGWKDKNCRA